MVDDHWNVPEQDWRSDLEQHITLLDAKVTALDARVVLLMERVAALSAQVDALKPLYTMHMMRAVTAAP
jgi:hypothetical protein